MDKYTGEKTLIIGHLPQMRREIEVLSVCGGGRSLS